MSAGAATRNAPVRSAAPAREWVLVLGATSPIARAIAAALAGRGHDLLLAARDEDELARCAADLRVRHGCGVETLPFDALRLDTHDAFVAAVEARTGGRLAGAVAAAGVLGDQRRAASDAGHAVEILQAGFVGIAAVLTGVARLLEARGAGFIIGITSVAGDRGRQSNYVYGAAKGGLALWLQGLRNRLHRSGVRVITVKPGFVDTGMTWGMPGLFLVAQPQRVGATIVRALDRRRDVIYVPGFWRWLMWIIRAIPEPLFKRMRL